MPDLFNTKDGITELSGRSDCEHGMSDKRDCFTCDLEVKDAKLKKEEEANAKDVENPDGSSENREEEI